MPVHRSFPARPADADARGTEVPPVNPEPTTPPTTPDHPDPASPAPTVSEPHTPPLTHEDAVVRSRTGAAWVGVCVGALVLVALVVFMMQNTAPVEVAFLGMSGSAPLALVMLIAGLAVGVVALVLGSLRIVQLRRRIHAGQRRADLR
ncbi:lipopolysaccharide assembly protein LapA domain-containing protein [Cellulomonas iranensis]|uniref:LapA family protein n=1 Tax=Cellulomonas iranensis TaxID=76862 RepID=UPI001CF1E94D|nr:lipopolysaccharide assembly protein LapA domain-containing protein [Cellulomonas iranensis]UCN14494.1 lipopolysaccharide assembly protein LapA domain-containing protein [Cellulomonas iranensis]